jgi:hypothetical protein
MCALNTRRTFITGDCRSDNLAAGRDYLPQSKRRIGSPSRDDFMSELKLRPPKNGRGGHLGEL